MNKNTQYFFPSFFGENHVYVKKEEGHIEM